MRKSVVVLTAAALLVVSLFGVASAAGPRDGGWRGPAPREGCWPGPECRPAVFKVNPTEEQLAQMRELQAELYEKVRDLHIKIMDKKFQLRQLYLTPDPDQAAIERTRAELQQLWKQVQELREEWRARLNEVLTEEQKKQLAGLFARRGTGRFGRGNGWGKRPHAPGI